ncbi:hypothetical protein BT63DRAFT_429216 [Microthyrium microscopicum]|uniref:DNA replication regulator SLD2 n=1 Tax=Microthyrium microscopicum TaxID=703497 RepID=A0A6A6TWG6_9PEZI|nr:hypothetical protein BT63DRAFT_429216 [Microthyrium microscopicum]
MADTEKSQCDILKSQIKDWEHSFRATNGNKPGRKDIGADPKIKALYVEYEQLRTKTKADHQSRKRKATGHENSPAPKKHDQHTAAFQGTPPKLDNTSKPESSRKRKATEVLESSTPKKSSTRHTFSTPQKQPQDVENFPESLTPCQFEATPQKNGIPIGIFDHIPPELLTATPTTARIALAALNGNIITRTPIKNVIPATPTTNRRKNERTPMSSARRFMLDQFVTPGHRKKRSEQTTPSSLDKQFQTPAFLKRYIEPQAVEEEDETVIRRLPWQRPRYGRSLSSMIKEMRDNEEDKADQELDILRELEEEAENPGQKPKPKKTVMFEDITPVKETQEEEGGLDQDGFIPSAFADQLKQIDDEEAAAAEKSGVQRRVYKKKGLKRQTKRVNMRPVRTRAAKPAEVEPVVDSDGSGDESDEVIPETQLDDELLDASFLAEAGDDDADFEPSNGSPKPTPSTIQPSPSPKVAGKKQKNAEKESEKTATKKAAPKKKTADRNNYRKLKIKSKNAKPKGRGGRFGRR